MEDEEGRGGELVSIYLILSSFCFVLYRTLYSKE